MRFGGNLLPSKVVFRTLDWDRIGRNLLDFQGKFDFAF